MVSLIQTLLTMTATASVAALCVMVLRLPLKKAPRWITCCLWLVVFLRMVCPTGLALPVSLVPQAISDGASVERILPAVQEAAPVLLPTVPTEGESDPQSAGATTGTAVTQAPAPEPAAPAWPAVLTGVWAAGVAAALLWAVVSYARLRRRIADAVRVEGNIYETDRIDTPFVCGFFQPRIYLPVTLDEDDRRYVLLHEQAHLRRRDHWAKPLAYLALCVHWFNPVLWLSYWLLCRDIETACDQAVIRSFDRADTAQYAAALLHLGQGPSLPTVVPLAFGEENAAGRVRSVLSYKKPAFWAVLAAVAACVVVGVLLLSDGHHWMDTSDVTSVKVFAANEQVNLPKELTEELIDLMEGSRLDEAEERTDTAEPPYWQEGLVTFYKKLEPGKDASYSFLKDQDELILLVEHYAGGDIFSTKQYPVPQDFQTAYETWQEKVNHYLWVTRPDQLFAQRGQEVQSEDDVSALLAPLNFSVTSRGYALQLDRQVTPHQLTIQLQEPPVLGYEKALLSAYLVSTEPVLFSLMGNVDTLSWETVDPLRDGANRMTTGPGLEDPEAFREAYRKMKEAGSSYLALSRSHAVQQVLYVAPQLAQQAKTTPLSEEIYELSFFHFSTKYTLGTGTETDYPSPYYRDAQDGTPANGFLTSLGAADRPGQASCTLVLNADTQDTGYRLYEWDGALFLAHFDLTGDQETPEYLVELSTTAL